jgi:hypothetical protein
MTLPAAQTRRCGGQGQAIFHRSLIWPASASGHAVCSGLRRWFGHLVVSAPHPYDDHPSRRNRWSQVKEQGSGKATRVQIAGLWIAASSLALALLRTVFDVLEVMGRRGGRQAWAAKMSAHRTVHQAEACACTRPVSRERSAQTRLVRPVPQLKHFARPRYRGLRQSELTKDPSSAFEYRPRKWFRVSSWATSASRVAATRNGPLVSRSRWMSG